jgi:hypothetical protein
MAPSLTPDEHTERIERIYNQPVAAKFYSVGERQFQLADGRWIVQQKDGTLKPR